MNLDAYRDSPLEVQRTEDLMNHAISASSKSARNLLDVGARDGHFSKLLASYFSPVTALDLQKPVIETEGVICVSGDITKLHYDDNCFDVVFCAEVLEHIPPAALVKACTELIRVSNQKIVIGVPYKQDIRLGRTTCQNCGAINPPWGHVNRFDLKRLQVLFDGLSVEKVSYVGGTRAKTNFLSAYLMNLAGNPYGTYEQSEDCINCSGNLGQPSSRTLLQKLYTRIAQVIRKIQMAFTTTQPNWIHITFGKSGTQKGVP